MGTTLCAKGGASFSFLYDKERPLTPMIRAGERGSGQWKNVSWDEAYTYITDKLKGIMAQHGAKSIMFSDRGGPYNDLRKAFMKAIGSPNYINHDCTSGRNSNHAAKSVDGLGRKGFTYDFKNARHIGLFGRNIMESIKVKEVKSYMVAVKNGAHITYVDPRVTNTAARATRYWRIKPGTDYALLLGITNYLVNNNLYDEDFCVGCKTCMTACSWGVPQWEADRGKVGKCNLCMDRIDQGLEPACVTKCTTGCLSFSTPELASDAKRQNFANFILSQKG